MKFVSSLRHAYRGVRFAYQNERHIRIQAVAGTLILVAGVFFDLSRGEWAVILLSIAGVIGLELVNSAVERLIDVVHPRLHERIQVVKDMMAASVLLASFCASVVGFLVFLPHVYSFIRFIGTWFNVRSLF